MTPIRLIAVDLDGTLLDPAGQISPRTLRAIAAAHDRGVVIVLATSRRFTGAAPIAEALGNVDALAVYDGAHVRAFPSGDILFAYALPAALGQRVSEIMAAHGLQPIAQHADAGGERLIAGPLSARANWAAAYLANAAAQVEHAPLARVCAGGPDPLRVVAFGPVRRARHAARAVAAHFAVAESIEPHMEVGTQVLGLGSYGAAELTVFSPAASKGSALTQLARHFDIPLSQTMAIGDGLNDISMLRAAGLGVAMGTAPRVVQRAASVLTGGNHEDGAAQAIERYVLESGARTTVGVTMPTRRPEPAARTQPPAREA